jgi:hypothetical protein
MIGPVSVLGPDQAEAMSAVSFRAPHHIIKLMGTLTAPEDVTCDPACPTLPRADRVEYWCFSTECPIVV